MSEAPVIGPSHSMASRGVVWMSPKPGIDQVVTSGVKISELKLSCAPDVRSRSETVSKNQGAVPYAGWRPAEPKQPNRR
ncbi:hypothetical protein GW17_00002742 [Ensete ventricosum]|nr:hypothetical protein GW17_00002742 [Ensete ventricosum]